MGGSGFGGLDLFFDVAEFFVEEGGFGVEEEGVKAALVFNGFDAVGGGADLEGFVEGLAVERDFLEVGEEASLGFVVGVGDVIP